MNKKVIIAIILIVILIGGGLAWAFVGKDDDGDTAEQTTSTSAEQKSSTDTSPTDSQADSSTQAAVITFTKDGFTPGSLTVKSGTVVTVKNASTQSVEFSSDDHPTHREDPEINMDTLKPGESGTFTATTVGTHGFHDHINDQFTGTLIVTN